MDFVDIVLYFGYFMVLIAAVLAIGFPLYIASKNPKSLITSGIGLRFNTRFIFYCMANIR